MDGTDRDLIRAFHANGDPGAIAELVRRHGRLVLGVPLRMTGDDDCATAVFQSTFIGLIESAPELSKARNGPESLAGWLHRRAIAATRKGWGLPPVGPVRAEDPPWRSALCRWDRVVAGLPEGPREAYLAAALLGLKPGQAASRLGLELPAVKARHARGEAALQRKLGLGPADFAELAVAAREEVPPPLHSQAAPVLAAACLGPCAAESDLRGAGVLPEALALLPRRRVAGKFPWFVAAAAVLATFALALAFVSHRDKAAVAGPPLTAEVRRALRLAPADRPAAPAIVPAPSELATAATAPTPAQEPAPALPDWGIGVVPPPPEPGPADEPEAEDRPAQALGFVPPADVEKGRKEKEEARDAAVLARRRQRAEENRDEEWPPAGAGRFQAPGRFVGEINVNGRVWRFNRPEDFARAQALLMRGMPPLPALRGQFPPRPPMPMPPRPRMMNGGPGDIEAVLRGLRLGPGGQ